MSKGILKTASGIVMKNSSPAAIEDYLVKTMQEALGEWKNAVKIRPFLSVDQEDADLSSNVKNAFGAIELDVSGVKLHIPFIIADKTLLPFDTIRMGEQEVAYDYSKLRRIVNGLEHRAKETEGQESGSATMELANFDDIQHNNGFLGTIMQIRDNHKNSDPRAYDEYQGAGFGLVNEDRILRTAGQLDVFNGFHEVMEKLAAVKTFTPEQLSAFEQHITKKAEAEAEEELVKTAAVNESMDAAKLRRDMMKLDEEKLFNVQRAASGNNIVFPIGSENRLEFRMGRVYRNFESWFKNTPNYTSGRLGAFVLDTKGGYSLLKANDPFMASTREPEYVDLPTTRARSLEAGPVYALEKDKTTLYNPFVVTRSWRAHILNEGMVLSVRERAHDKMQGSRTANTLFTDVFTCKEVLPGKYTNKNNIMFAQEEFSIIVTKGAGVLTPKTMSHNEVLEFITEYAEDPQDALLAKEMLSYTGDCVLVPEDLPFFHSDKNIKGFYTRPDGLFTEGPLAKTAAYEGQNKATLIVKNNRNPKTYAVEWKFVKNESAPNGAAASKLETRYKDGLSKDQAQAVLANLGYDYRAQARFFEIADRNGRNAIFPLPDRSKAQQAAPSDVAQSKAKKKMKAIADNMLNSKNFLPIMEDAIAGNVAAIIGGLAPQSIDAAHKVGDILGMKEAQETAVAIEKVASDLNGPVWHELSALLNMKYRLDKVALDVLNGNYLAGGTELFEKVAEFKPVIEKKASDLVKMNRQQLLRTTSYLVKPALVKEALTQLDGLYTYATAALPNEKKKTLEKKAGLFSGAKKELALLKDHLSKATNFSQDAQTAYADKHAYLRALVNSDADEESVRKALAQAQDAEATMSQQVSDVQEIMAQQGMVEQEIAHKNLGLAAGIGIPGLVAASYGNEYAKDHLGKQASDNLSRAELQEVIDQKRAAEKQLGAKAGFFTGGLAGAAAGSSLFKGGKQMGLAGTLMGGSIGMYGGSHAGKQIAQNTFDGRHAELINKRDRAE